MVATRSSLRGSTAELEEIPQTPSTTRKSTRKSNPVAKHWAHTPSHLILIWLTVSLPLVCWDTGYLLGRPHTMPGGKWHEPVWKPYGIYSRVDQVYGWIAFNENNGWAGAQAYVNILETLVYIAYLVLVGVYGQDSVKKGRGAPPSTAWSRSWWGRARTMKGKIAGIAVLLGFSAALSTLSKTLLYALHEHCSGYKYTHQNTWVDLTRFYIIPNGLWIIFSIIMLWVFGSEILEGIIIASGDDPRDSLVAIKDE